MESTPKSDLADLNRLAAKASSEATAFPVGASAFLTVAELLLVGLFVLIGWSTVLIVGWLAFFATFHLVMHLRRRARPRMPWATMKSRRDFAWAAGTTVAVNAVWIPLFLFARPIALGLLVAALLYSLVGNLVWSRHA